RGSGGGAGRRDSPDQFDGGGSAPGDLFAPAIGDVGCAGAAGAVGCGGAEAVAGGVAGVTSASSSITSKWSSTIVFATVAGGAACGVGGGAGGFGAGRALFGGGRASEIGAGFFGGGGGGADGAGGAASGAAAGCFSSGGGCPPIQATSSRPGSSMRASPSVIPGSRTGPSPAACAFSTMALARKQCLPSERVAMRRI